MTRTTQAPARVSPIPIPVYLERTGMVAATPRSPPPLARSPVQPSLEVGHMLVTKHRNDNSIIGDCY